MKTLKFVDFHEKVIGNPREISEKISYEERGYVFQGKCILTGKAWSRKKKKSMNNILKTTKSEKWFFILLLIRARVQKIALNLN